MRKSIIVGLFVSFSASIAAQERNVMSANGGEGAANSQKINTRVIENERRTLLGASDVTYEIPYEYSAVEDSLSSPLLRTIRYINNSWYYPMNSSSYGNWILHEGLNLSLGASVFATFGKSPYKGAGFTQNLTAIYAMPLGSRASLSIGGYFNNMYWAHDNYHDTGLTAVFGYKFNEHWEGYLYGQKSLGSKILPYPLYDISEIGDRIGTAIRYNVNKNLSFQVAFEREWHNH